MPKTTTKKKTKKIMAVDLAKDVLKLLKSTKILTSGATGTGTKYSCYVEMNDETQRDFAGKSMQKAMSSKKYKPCSVCALGSLFLAHIDKRNQIKVPTYGISSFNNLRVILETLSKYFSPKQLALIETAYECRNVGSRESDMLGYTGTQYAIDTMEGNGTVARDTAIAFGQQFASANDRLEAIMKNIIFNDGKFRPHMPAVIYE